MHLLGTLDELRAYFDRDFLQSNFGDMLSKAAQGIEQSKHADESGAYEHDYSDAQLYSIKKHRIIRNCLKSMPIKHQFIFNAYFSDHPIKHTNPQFAIEFKDLSALIAHLYPISQINKLLASNDVKQIQQIKTTSQELLNQALLEYKFQIIAHELKTKGKNEGSRSNIRRTNR